MMPRAVILARRYAARAALIRTFFMAWSNSPASAPISPLPPVSDAAIDAALNEAANALRFGNQAGAAARLAELVPDLVASAERCDLAGLILLGAKKPVEALVWFDRARRLQPNLLAGAVACRRGAARARPPQRGRDRACSRRVARLRQCGHLLSLWRGAARARPQRRGDCRARPGAAHRAGLSRSAARRRADPERGGAL